MLTKSPSLVLLLISRPTSSLHSLARLTAAASVRPVRFASSTPSVQQPSKKPATASGNQQQQAGDSDSSKSSSSFSNSINYTFAVAIGTVAGLITGYVLVTDSKQLDNVNELSRSLLQAPAFEVTRFIENSDSKYHNFPLKIHLYQYESCAYCSQIRAYLDYFGFSYMLTEVDSYSKQEITKFTKARTLPILVIEDKHTKRRWHLANATSILSALESVRNDKPINFPQILDQYLPILKGNVVYNTFNPFKYHISNSDLNSIEWRKWINNYAIPAFKINSMSSLKDLFETFDHIALTSHWRERYSPLKYNYVYYNHAFKANNTYSSLMSQLDSTGQKKPREILHLIVDKWEQGLGDKKFIDNDDHPTIADLSMFGNVRAYEGCAMFRESIANHPKFRSWYERMKATVLRGYKEAKLEQTRSRFFFLESVSDDDDDKDEALFAAESTQAQKPNTTASAENKTKSGTKQEQTSAAAAAEAVTSTNESSKSHLSELFIFRVLTLNYLSHLIVFTYAAYAK